MTEYTEAYNRGINHGWDAANYAEAYEGGWDTSSEQAQRRAADEYPTDTLTAAYYASSFEEGWERFTRDQWQDGSERI